MPTDLEIFSRVMTREREIGIECLRRENKRLRHQLVELLCPPRTCACGCGKRATGGRQFFCGHRKKFLKELNVN
jgi:hypothetical protein